MRDLHILLAPDSFKGSLSSLQAAKCMEKGIRKVFSSAIIQTVPIADGGEGTVEALVSASKGIYKTNTVTGPLGRPVKAVWGRLPGGTAVIESAAASGLPLVKPEERDPLAATTYGTGELIRAALDEGCRRIVLGIGGSATTDGGAGMAQALGVSLRDAQGQEIGFGGGTLSAAVALDATGLDPRLRETEIVAACDVRNPLVGENGAAAVYGPQKGGDGGAGRAPRPGAASSGPVDGTDARRRVWSQTGSRGRRRAGIRLDGVLRRSDASRHRFGSRHGWV